MKKSDTKISKRYIQHYMAGWAFRHKNGFKVPDRTIVLSNAWAKGFSDCCQGKIDARCALGPEFIEIEKPD